MGKIVWIVSYPKSGNTWMRAFLWNYFRDSNVSGSLDELSTFAVSESNPERYRRFADGADVGSLSHEQLAMLRTKVQSAMAESADGILFAKAHNYLGTFADYPLYNFGVTGGAVYVVRNPLDVVVSMADHFGLTIDSAIDFMENDETAGPTNRIAVAEFYASWSTHVASWTARKHPNVLVVRYEDLLERPTKAFLAVLKLLNRPKDKDRLRRAIRLSSFRELRNQEDKQGFSERSEHSHRFFRVGRKDQWRDVLSRQQAERIIARHEEQMRRFDYVPKVY